MHIAQCRGGKTMAYNKTKYNNEYNKTNYERLNILVKKGMKEYIGLRAKETFGSINQYVNALIQMDLEKTYTQSTTSPNEQFILDQYKYGTEEARKIIFDAAIKADKLNYEAGKEQLFNKVVNMHDNNGIINM